MFHLDLQACRWQRVPLQSLRILLWGACWLQCCQCQSTMSPVASQQPPQACGRRAASQIQEGSSWPANKSMCIVQKALHNTKVPSCAAGSPPLKTAFSSNEKEQQLEVAAELHRRCAQLLQLWPTSMQQDAVLQQQQLPPRHWQASYSDVPTH